MILVIDKIGEEVDENCVPPGFEDIDDCFANVDTVVDLEIVPSIERLQLSMEKMCCPITVLREHEPGFLLQAGEAQDIIRLMQYELSRLSNKTSFHDYASGLGNAVKIERLASGHLPDNKYWFYWHDEFMDFRHFMFSVMPTNDKDMTFVRVVKAIEVT